MPSPANHQLFYAPPSSLRGDRIRFGRDESSHMVASLRLAAGVAITVTDGAGRVFEAELEVADREAAVARVKGVREVPPPEVTVTLFQAMIRPQRMALVVEKCVELGVGCIVPVLSERALGRDAGARLERWRRIGLEAMKQSLRLHLPDIRGAVGFDRALEEAGRLELLLVAHKAEATGPPPPRELAIGRGKIGLFIGPEGGFTEGEMRALADRGARVFGMGEGRLKSETAAIAAMAVIGSVLQGLATSGDG